MAERLNLEGQMFGHWTALEYVGNSRWLCRCACGKEKKVKGSVLNRGRSLSCSCRRIANQTRHGGSRTPEYKIWSAFKDRCLNPANPGYARYGARGISVFPEWIASFGAFISHIGPRPSPKHSIDRIDNDRGYEPGNVRWATRKQQQRNIRTNRIVTFRGERMTLAQASERAGIPYVTMFSRLMRGWTVQEALGRAYRPNRPRSSRRVAGASTRTKTDTHYE